MMMGAISFHRICISDRDGLAKHAEFYQPAGLCVEFDHVVYVCDARTSCIKVFTTLTETATFLDAVGKIYKAFSIHDKHAQYQGGHHTGYRNLTIPLPKRGLDKG